MLPLSLAWDKSTKQCMTGSSRPTNVAVFFDTFEVKIVWQLKEKRKV